MKEIIYRNIALEDNVSLAKTIRGILEEFGVDQPGTVYTDPTTDQLYQLFREKHAHYILAELDGEIIGGCGIFPTSGLPENHVELVKLYLKSAYRGKGVGQKLMELCFELAKKEGFKFIYLESLPELNIAVGLYKKMGFMDVPERLGNSGHFACSILMLKEL